MNRKSMWALLAFGTVLGLPGAGLAETMYGQGDKVTADQLIQQLAPDEATQDEVVSAPPGKTRGISMEPIRKVIRTPKAPPAEKSVSLQVYFDYKSAELSEEAKRQLAPMGEALASSKLKTLDFTIEGHTDSKGGMVYNQELSEARARAVKEFLVMQYGIAPGRINAVGKGKSAPFDTAHPESAVNRRVRVVARQ